MKKQSRVLPIHSEALFFHIFPAFKDSVGWCYNFPYICFLSTFTKKVIWCKICIENKIGEVYAERL